MKDLQADILNDYQHSITRKIERHGEEETFPRLSDYDITKANLDDYLFDKQAILDCRGSSRSRLTLAGILMVLPIIVLSAFPTGYLYDQEINGLFLGLLIGVVLVTIVNLLQLLFMKLKLKQLNNPQIESYLKSVEAYGTT